MSDQYKEIATIARASLMPDFFAVRIEEEQLFGKLQEMIAKITHPTPVPQLESIKQIAAAATNATGFTDAIKAKNLWTVLRELLSKVKVA